MSSLLAVALADLRERSRRGSFLALLGSTVLFGWAALPDASAGYLTFSAGGARMAYGMAAVGALAASLTSMILLPVGFFFVRDALALDRRTGLHEVLAAAPLSKASWVAGKALSSAALLGTAAAAAAVAALVTQRLRGEDAGVDLVGFFSPWLLLTAPVVLFTAALALLFETLPGLKGALGTIVFFGLWLSLLVLDAGSPSPLVLFGLSPLLESAAAACRMALAGACEGGLNVGITSRGPAPLATFPWRGLPLSGALVWSRLGWLFGSFLIIVLATLLFRPRGSSHALPGPAPGTAEALPAARTTSGGSEGRTLSWAGGPRVRLGQASGFWELLIAELRLRWLGANRFHLLAVASFAALALAAPVGFVRDFVLPFSLLAPLSLWAGLGSEERLTGMDALLGSAPRPRARFFASWLCGAVVCLLFSGLAGLRLSLAGTPSSALAILVGAAFVPALALALGRLSGSRRPFEGTWGALWYIGVLSGAPALDFTAPGAAGARVGLALVSLALLWAGSRWTTSAPR